MKHSPPPFCAAVLALLTLTGCGGEPADSARTYTLQFEAKVGSEPFACDTTYAAVGASKSTIEGLDFRFYVHDLELVRADETSVPLELEQDDKWQRDGLALLDFEDGTGACATSSAETRTVVKGSAKDPGDVVGLRFTLGVPESMNHLDAATAPAPLNVQGLWWTWQGGYKFARIDMKTAQNPAFFFHLGATSCDGSVAEGFQCTFDNNAAIDLADFDPDTSKVVIDLARLYADSDMEAQPDFQTDFVSGCMAFSADPECPVIFEKLGMRFEDSGAEPAGQVLFSAEAR